MRLSERERNTIMAAARRHFGAACRVRLFGSRTDDAARGGDIDLHVTAASAGEASLTRELAFRADLTDQLGEERIDILVRGPDDPPHTIDRIALRDGLVLS